MVYQEKLKKEIANAMDVPAESLDLYHAAWAAIREAYQVGDLVGCRRLIETLTK